MFRLYDKTRRTICISGFFLLCIVPTTGVLVWCVQRHLPGYAEAEGGKLRRALGLSVRLETVTHLRPGVVLYKGLELADPETGHTVLRCRMLEAAWKLTTDQDGQGRSSLVLIASQPEIESAGLDRLGQLLRHMLQRRTGRDEVDVRLMAREVTLRAEKTSQTLTELQGSIEPGPGGTQAGVSFRLAGVEELKPIRIRITRNRQTDPPTTGFELDTGGGAVPCNVLAMGLPILEPLGSRSRFRGLIWANQTFDANGSYCWDVEMSGRLLEVDLGKLVSERFPHKLSGMAEATIQSARFRQGRLEEAAGTLDAGPGVISRSLIDASIEQLRLVPGVMPKRPGNLVQYEQLALAFAIDSQGLQLQGRCPGSDPVAILVDGYNCLLSASGSQPRPVVALLQTLVPASRLQVPATRQTDWLMRHLPIPNVVPPEDAEAVLPHVRLRVGRRAEE